MGSLTESWLGVADSPMTTELLLKRMQTRVGSNFLICPPKMINYREIPSNLGRLHRGGARHWFLKNQWNSEMQRVLGKRKRNSFVG